MENHNKDPSQDLFNLASTSLEESKLLHEKKIRLLINQTRLGNLFGSPTWREKMEKFGYENAAMFKVLPTWPFSSLFSWMDRRKRITEGESLDTALPQLATAWSMDHAVGYRTSILSSEFLSLAHLFSHVCIGMDGSVHRVMQYWRVWRHANVFVI